MALISLAVGALSGALIMWKIQHEKRKRKKDNSNNHALLLLDQQQHDLILQQGNNNKNIIYLDYNGTTPVYRHVLEAMLPYFTTHYGNPSSGHALADGPKRAIQTARRNILEHLLKASSIKDHNDDNNLNSIIFTSCGTESDNLAIHWALQHYYSSSATKNNTNNKTGILKRKQQQQLPHIVTSNIEHAAVDSYLKVLQERNQCTVTFVPVQTDGRVLYEDIVSAISSPPNRNTILVTLMLANNETGAIQPVKQVAEYCRAHDILMHTDAAQAAGKISVSLEDLGHPDMVSLVGHKIGAPKGIACLYVRPDCPLLLQTKATATVATSMVIGGAQEWGRRAGTENVPYIVGMGAAAVYAGQDVVKRAQYLESLRSRLLQQLQEKLGNESIRVNGPDDPAWRLPNTLSVGIRQVQSGQLLQDVRNQVAASAGATCHSACSVSSVLTAMNVPLEFARGTLRLSFGPTMTVQEIDRAADIIADAVQRQLTVKETTS